MKPPVPTEASEQAKLCRLLDLCGVAYFAIPNGGSRDIREAARMKQQGVKAGVPDLCIVSRPHKHPTLIGGVYVEMKRTKGGHLSAAQEAWIETLVRNGHHVIVAHGADEARRELEKLGYRLGREA